MNIKWLSLGLSLLGIGGTALTSWVTVKCHEKAKEKETRKEKAICYIPAGIAFVGTSACILGGRHIDRKEIAALTASCTYLASKSDKIERKARELIGDEKVSDMKRDAAKEIVKERRTAEAKSTIEQTGHGNAHFIEDMFGREFYCSTEHVDWACKMLNHMFMQGERVNYNTWYELLGLKKTRAGWENGWPCNEDIYGYSVDTPIAFDRTPVTDENGDTMWIVSCRMTPPVNGYLEMEE